MNSMTPITQPTLVTEILALLDRLQPGCKVNHRQLNAVIEAADLIAAALASEHVPATSGTGLVAWLASDDVGSSSKYMAGVCTGRFSSSPRCPIDAGDFGRCVRMLDAVPDARENMGRMRGVSRTWDALLDRWQELESLYREEIPSGRCRKLNALIHSILDGIRDSSPSSITTLTR